ncbi:MAG: squalene synthase HpnC [Caulobacterales bacterium]
MSADALASGKTHKDENFPVGSFIIARRHRPLVMAFYRFARCADDVADHPTTSVAERLALLDAMRATLQGEADASPEGVELRAMLLAHGLTIQHGLDLLEAFRRDISKRRYADWDELMDYCRYSAAPVGRMMLDIHGEPQNTWAASDALCAALQVINHLQDCAKDYRELDRVYLPHNELEAAGAGVENLAAPKATPALRGVIRDLAQRTQELLARGRPLASQIRDSRLRLEVAFIQRIAEDLTRRLLAHDPLSERVHHRKLELLGIAGLTLARMPPGPRRHHGGVE